MGHHRLSRKQQARCSGFPFGAQVHRTLKFDTESSTQSFELRPATPRDTLSRSCQTQPQPEVVTLKVCRGTPSTEKRVAFNLRHTCAGHCPFNFPD